MVLHCRTNKHGFTLTEMVIVLAVGGILTAIAIPTFLAWAPKYRVNGAARQVFSQMMAAKAKAISENNRYIISFDIANDRFTIHDDDNSDGTQDAGESVKTVNIAAAYPEIEFGHVDATNPSGDAITGDVTFTGTPPRAIFYPSGLAKAGAVYLKPAEDTTRRDRQRCITVLLTGRVRLYKHMGDDWE